MASPSRQKSLEKWKASQKRFKRDHEVLKKTENGTTWILNTEVFTMWESYGREKRQISNAPYTFLDFYNTLDTATKKTIMKLQ